MPRTPKAHPSGRPLPLRLARTRTPAMGASAGQPGRAQPTPQGGGQRPTSSQRGSSSTSNQGGHSSTSSQGGRPSAPRQSSRPASTSGGATPTTSGGPTDQPPSRRGAGDSTWADWYQMAMQESRGRISEPQGPPYPIGLAHARWEAVGQIYDRVDGKEPPAHNIASEALQAYYMRVDPQTLNTLACQVLCMIAEYHMACMTRGSPVTSPLVPGELEEHLLPLTNYAPPEDHSGVTDVRVRDHWAQTLQVAVWCHCLDMTLSEPTSSGSLVRSRHRMGHFLAYFLGPGMAWGLQFKDVVTQVLKENWQQLET